MAMSILIKALSLAGERWRACSSNGIKFFLYVPEGYAAKAARIALKHGIPVTRLRTYTFDDLWHIRMTAV